MKKYSVLLVTNDQIDVTADGVYVSDGALVFYKEAPKTESDDESSPDTTVMILAPTTWTLVTLEKE